MSEKEKLEKYEKCINMIQELISEEENKENEEKLRDLVAEIDYLIRSL